MNKLFNLIIIFCLVFGYSLGDEFSHQSEFDNISKIKSSNGYLSDDLLSSFKEERLGSEIEKKHGIIRIFILDHNGKNFMIKWVPEGDGGPLLFIKISEIIDGKISLTYSGTSNLPIKDNSNLKKLFASSHFDSLPSKAWQGDCLDCSKWIYERISYESYDMIVRNNPVGLESAVKNTNIESSRLLNEMNLTAFTLVAIAYAKMDFEY